MKRKMTGFILAVVWIAAVLSGCGALSEEEQTMRQIQSANTTAALLEQYENIEATYEFPDGYKLLIFMDKETYLYTDDTHSMTFLFTPQEQCETGLEDGVEYFDRYINPFDADLGAAWREKPFMAEMTSKEKVASFTQENGVLYIETRLRAEDMSQADMEYLGVSLAKGEYYACEYEVDAQTYRVLHSEEYIIRADGSREDLGRVTIRINAERPEYIAELELRGNEIDALSAEQTRVITCIIDPGQETERTVSKTVEKGCYVLFPEDLQGYEIYMDAEGMQPLVNAPGQDAESNITAYLIKAK